MELASGNMAQSVEMGGRTHKSVEYLEYLTIRSELTHLSVRTLVHLAAAKDYGGATVLCSAQVFLFI